MATIYKADGTTEEIQPKNGKDFKLDELQEIVGGYIETLYLKNKEVMVVNEEGKLNNLSLNEKATVYLLDQNYADVILGNALVCKQNEIK